MIQIKERPQSIRCTNLHHLNGIHTYTPTHQGSHGTPLNIYAIPPAQLSLSEIVNESLYYILNLKLYRHYERAIFVFFFNFFLRFDPFIGFSRLRDLKGCFESKLVIGESDSVIEKCVMCVLKFFLIFFGKGCYD